MLCSTHSVWHVRFSTFVLVHSVDHGMLSTFCSVRSVYHVLFSTFCSARTVQHVLFSTYCWSRYVQHVLFSVFGSAHCVQHVLFSTLCSTRSVELVLLTNDLGEILGWPDGWRREWADKEEQRHHWHTSVGCLGREPSFLTCFEHPESPMESRWLGMSTSIYWRSSSSLAQEARLNIPHELGFHAWCWIVNAPSNSVRWTVIIWTGIFSYKWRYEGKYSLLFCLEFDKESL